MSYSGAGQAKQAREVLGQALAALQEDPNVPSDVMQVAQNIAQAVGALFEAEKASSEPDGKACVRSALGSLSQTLALLQDVRGAHRGIATASQVLARAMSVLYPLTAVPSRPPAAQPAAPAAAVPKAAPVPSAGAATVAQRPAAAPAPAAVAPIPAPQVAPSRNEPRQEIEANIGATTQSNFYVGFSGEISEGGVFVATYETVPRGTPVQLLVTLPGGFETKVHGRVRFVRDPLDFSAETDPGMGVAFEGLDPSARELILRFIRKRAPMFYDE